MRNPQDTMENRKARGMRIRWARELVEPTRTEAARKLGIDVSTLRYIEDGKTNPGVYLTLKLCHSLRISLDYIVAGTLTGVDPELAALLVAHHPELTPYRPLNRKSDNSRTGSPANTFAS